MSYRIIRLSEDCGVAIIVSPPDTEPWSEDNKYWVMNHNVKEFETFKEAGVNTVLGYFGGIADGMGWYPIPDIIFEEIKDVEKWVRENKIKFYKDRYKELYDNPESRKELEESIAEEKGENIMSEETTNEIVHLSNKIAEIDKNIWSINYIKNNLGFGYEYRVKINEDRFTFKIPQERLHRLLKSETEANELEKRSLISELSKIIKKGKL